MIKLKVYLIISFLIWCYIIYRAFAIPITQDEAHTYLLVKTNNWRQIVGTANTHWLNTIFIRFFLWLPGTDHTWKLRMLSMSAWAIYSFSTIKISLNFKNSWLGVAFFIAAIGNPFLIFYFSLARGYAAACAFIMLALWQVSALLVNKEVRPEKWARKVVLDFLISFSCSHCKFFCLLFLYCHYCNLSNPIIAKK
jgi:hypothetical protein